MEAHRPVLEPRDVVAPADVHPSASRLTSIWLVSAWVLEIGVTRLATEPARPYTAPATGPTKER